VKDSDQLDNEPNAGSHITVKYCNIEGGLSGVLVESWGAVLDSTVTWLEGNIVADPQFADAGSGDYHLKSQAGRWDPTGKLWVYDDVNSPCIDTGDPDSDWTAELWPHGKQINMGAFGGTAEASMSLSTEGLRTDLNKDGVINNKDLSLLAGMWLAADLPMAGDINRDGLVNFPDFAWLTQLWLYEE